jgi:hypothetical protein
MMKRKRFGAGMCALLALVFTVVSWGSSKPAGAEERPVPTPVPIPVAAADSKLGYAVVPNALGRQIILMQLELKRLRGGSKPASDDGIPVPGGQIPDDLELTLVCDGDYIVVYDENDDGTISGITVYCCNDMGGC